MESWLKDTVVGIIVLGAIGSLLSVLLLWMIKLGFNRLGISFSKLVEKLHYNHGFFMGYLSHSKDLGQHFSYFIYRMALFTLACVSFIGSVILFCISFLLSSDLATIWMFLVGVAVAGFTSAFFMFRFLFGFQIDYKYLVKSTVTKLMQKVDEERSTDIPKDKAVKSRETQTKTSANAKPE